MGAIALFKAKLIGSNSYGWAVAKKNSIICVLFLDPV